MLSVWQALAMEHRLLPVIEVKEFIHAHAALDTRALVLLNWAQDFSRRDLDKLLSSGAAVVAHFSAGATISPRVVIENIPALLLDCCSEDTFDKNGFRRRINRILAGDDPYANIHLMTPERVVVQKPASVFLSTPLADELFEHVDAAAPPAMKALGIRIRNPAEEPETGTTIHRAVLDAIDACDVVIANLREKRGKYERGHNANVWFEIGYAWKAKKPVLLFRHVDDRLKRPSDVENFNFHTYSDAIDLAMQLYYGFGGSANPSPSLTSIPKAVARESGSA